MRAAPKTQTFFFLLVVSLGAPALAHPPMDASTPPELAIQPPKPQRPTKKKRRRYRHRRRLNLVQLTSGPGFWVLKPDRAYGRPQVVFRLNEVLCAYHAEFGPDAAPLLIGDLSKKGGGKLEPHQSHRSGRDVDIAVVRKDRVFDRPVATSPRTMDVKRTWWLIHTLIETGEVQYVFINGRLIRPLYRYARKQGISKERLLELFHYPRRSRWGMGIIRAEPGHLAHFHVRFHRPAKTLGPVM
jgi:murein endopeptidase